MKDIIIPAAALCRELRIAVGCFLAAVAVNAGAVIAYERPWTELFSQIGYVIVIAAALYLLLWPLRLLGRGVCLLGRRIRK